MDRKNRTHILAKFLKKEGHMIGVMRWTMVSGVSPGPAKEGLVRELGNAGTWPTAAIRFIVREGPTDFDLYSQFKWHGVPITEFVRYIMDSVTDPMDF